MKKHLFYAAAAAAMLCACSNDEDVKVSNPTDTLAEAGYEKIVFGHLSTNAATVTRADEGHGVVNNWTAGADHQKVYVLMTSIDADACDASKTELDAGKWGYTSHRGLGDLNGPIFMNTETQPVMVGTAWSLNYQLTPGAELKYYPARGASDFFGYYVDGALATATSVPYFADDADELLLDIKINGNQDVMAGKAVNADVTGTREGFSAATARGKRLENAGTRKDPEIKLEHLLTQFTFHVIPNTSAQGMKIESISLKSRATGQMVVAYNELGVRQPEKLIRWSGTADFMALPGITAEAPYTISTEAVTKANGYDSSNPYANPENFATRVNDNALMIEPELDDITVKVVYWSPVIDEKGNVVTDKIIKRTQEFPLALVGGGSFKAGYAYKVMLRMYGEESIQVFAKVAAWEEGETVVWDVDMLGGN